jgi:hypothetical protein
MLRRFHVLHRGTRIGAAFQYMAAPHPRVGAVCERYAYFAWLAIVLHTNGTYLSQNLHFSSFLRKQESSGFKLSGALDPRFRGDDKLK